MPYHVYVLANPDDRIYIGQTQDLQRRFCEHNDSDDRTTFHTKRYPGPWRLLHSETFSTRSEAIRRERQLKGGQGRQWIRTLLEAPGQKCLKICNTPDRRSASK